MTTGIELARIERAYFAWLGGRHRPAHSRRTAERHAAFFLPLLRPGMDLLDLGCGPGSITAGLARTVAPGHCTGIDTDEGALQTARSSFPEPNLEFKEGIAEALPFEDCSFDAVFAHTLLQHVDDASAVVAEAFRVLRPGGLMGVADADFGGSIVGPSLPALDKALDLMTALRRGRGDTFVGRKLGVLLSGAGFDGVTVGVRADIDSGAETTAYIGDHQAAYFEARELRAYATAHTLASETNLDAIVDAWRAWGRTPGAMWARFWCYATARKPV